MANLNLMKRADRRRAARTAAPAAPRTPARSLLRDLLGVMDDVRAWRETGGEAR